MTTRTWKVYGRTGHRQATSFDESHTYNFSSNSRGTRIIELINSDKTGTNEYTIARITCDSAEACERELWGQISDGIWENYRVGKVEEVLI